MNNYPPGAANDPKAPYNEPLTKYAKVTVEATVEVGTIMKLEVEVDEDNYPSSEDLLNTVAKAFRQKYGIKDPDTIVDIHIWDWR